MASDDEAANKHGDSDLSHSENDIDIDDNKQTSKSIITDRIAKDLVNSRDPVDRRLLKIHKIFAVSNNKIDLIKYLGVKASLSKSLTQNLR